MRFSFVDTHTHTVIGTQWLSVATSSSSGSGMTINGITNLTIGNGSSMSGYWSMNNIGAINVAANGSFAGAFLVIQSVTINTINTFQALNDIKGIIVADLSLSSYVNFNLDQQWPIPKVLLNYISDSIPIPSGH
jgi:hypothetical protein